MNTKGTSAHKKMALDTNVLVVMLSTIVLSLGLISYKVIEKKTCTPFSVSVKALTTGKRGVFDVGETLIFRTSLTNGKDVVWNFGDNTGEEEALSANMRHKFAQEGNYTVSASIGGDCSNSISVKIVKSNKIDTSAGTAATQLLKIYGNLSPVAGKAERYLCDMIGDAYEWKVLDKSSFPTISEQYALFTFPKPGAYTLQLTLDHDRQKRTQIQINVVDDPAKSVSNKIDTKILIPFDPPPKIKDKQIDEPKEKELETITDKPPIEPPLEVSVKKKTINIRNEIFKSKLEGVVLGQNSVHDFDAYLQDGGDTKVLVNNDKKYKTFKQLCEDISGKKKITIQEVELVRTEDNAIQQIKVKYKKSLF